MKGLPSNEEEDRMGAAYFRFIPTAAYIEPSEQMGDISEKSSGNILTNAPSKLTKMSVQKLKSECGCTSSGLEIDLGVIR